MEESRKLLHGTVLPVRHETGLAPVHSHGTQIEGYHEQVVNPPSSPDDPHCHDHSHFVATCETCRRARAAFLPYPALASKQPVSRSFNFKDQMTEAEIYRLTRSDRRDDLLNEVLLADALISLLDP